MSRALDMLLDPARLADCAKNDKALMVDRGPAAPAGGHSFDVAMAAMEAGAQRIEVTPRFPMTYCSQCGEELGPGDAGVSHCDEHTSEADALVNGQGYLGELVS